MSLVMRVLSQAGLLSVVISKEVGLGFSFMEEDHLTSKTPFYD